MCTQIYASVPFEEDLSDPNVWFLDHDYLENMFAMFKKVNGMFIILRFYIRFSSGTYCWMVSLGSKALYQRYQNQRTFQKIHIELSSCCS